MQLTAPRSGAMTRGRGRFVFISFLLGAIILSTPRPVVASFSGELTLMGGTHAGDFAYAVGGSSVGTPNHPTPTMLMLVDVLTGGGLTFSPFFSRTDVAGGGYHVAIHAFGMQMRRAGPIGSHVALRTGMALGLDSRQALLLSFVLGIPLARTGLEVQLINDLVRSTGSYTDLYHLVRFGISASTR